MEWIALYAATFDSCVDELQIEKRVVPDENRTLAVVRFDLLADALE